MSSRGLYNCDCDRYCPNGWGKPVNTVYFYFIPRHCISFSVLLNTSYLESRNIKLINNMCYTEFKCKVTEHKRDFPKCPPFTHSPLLVFFSVPFFLLFCFLIKNIGSILVIMKNTSYYLNFIFYFCITKG
jgi:hypothetical protein